MLTVTKTTVSKDANESIGEYSYNLSTTIQDGVLNSVMCRISKSVKTVGSKTPGVPNVNNPVNIGYVQLSGGQISSQIIESEDGTVHLSQFKNFLDEIKNGKRMDNILKGTNNLLVIAVMACVIVLIAMLIDLAGGLHKARQRGEIRSSYGLKRSIGKFIMYEGSMMIACGIDLLMHFCKLLQVVHLNALYGIPVITCLIGIFLLAIEFISLFEKADNKTKTEVSRIEKFAVSMSKHEDVLKAIFEYIKSSENNKNDN